MNKLQKTSVILCLILVMAFVLTSPVSAATSSRDQADKLVIGNTYTLSEGETYNGNLLVVGGTANLEKDSLLNGDIYLLGATLDVNGTVSGDIIAFGGNVSIHEGGIIKGDINSAGAFLDVDPMASVEGDINTETSGSFWVQLPQDVRIPRFNVSINPFFEILWFAFRTLLWAILAMLIVMFLVKPADRIAHAIVSEPLISGGVGLLTIVVAPVILIVLSLTLILIPLTFTVGVALVIAWGFGVIALGLELGRRISKGFKQEWHPALAAGLGTFALIFVVNGLDALIPCIGWIPKLILGVLGLGGVLITFFGTRNYPIEQDIPSDSLTPTNTSQTNLVQEDSSSEQT